MKILSTLFLTSFAAILAAVTPGDARADAALFEGSGCNGCHYTDGPAKEKTIDDQLAKKGPELWYAGSKFQAPWLEAWLQDPKQIRPMAYNSITDKNPGDHPKMDAAGATTMSAYLMSLTSSDVEAGTVKPKYNPKGRLIFNKKQPCSGCHQSPDKKGKVSGGMTGPSLVGAATRLNPDWILAFLKKSNTFKPVKDMPNFDGLLSDKDMLNVSRYIASFK
ncbi:MAG: c-type cytochrome [Rhodospirillaceae bacterium]|nr:c-type cytochrome [Rhodospirillaceae bacterium]